MRDLLAHYLCWSWEHKRHFDVSAGEPRSMPLRRLIDAALCPAFGSRLMMEAADMRNPIHGSMALQAELVEY